MKSYFKYWQSVIATLMLSGLMLFPLMAAAAGTTVFEQSPNHLGGFDSQFSGAVPESQRIVVADEFQLDRPILIDNITWWGSPRTFGADTFTVRLYADNGGRPGATLQSFEALDHVAETSTGEFVLPPDPQKGFDGIPEVQYSFDLPTAFLAGAHTRYWLSVFTVPAFDEEAWEWEDSSSALHPGVQRSTASDSGPWEPKEGNAAFRLRGSAAPALTVWIDIQPDSFLNRINPKSIGKIPVAILSSATFDAPSQVDQTSLQSSPTFGRTGDEQSLVRCSSLEDVNADGLLDLVCHFSTQATGFQPGDTQGVLKGKTVSGQPLIGTDSVQIVP